MYMKNHKQIMKSSNNSSNKALSTALKCLSRRQMTMFQLTNRLTQKGFNSEEITFVVDKLLEWKYLDDHGHAVLYCKSKRDKYSRARIRMELEKVGIDKTVIVSVLDDFYYRDREHTNCLNMGHRIFTVESEKWKKRYDNLTNKYPFEIIIKKKIGDKLLQKGYPLDIIKNILEQIIYREKL